MKSVKMLSKDFLYSNNDHERDPSLLKVTTLFMASMGQTPSILDARFSASLRGVGRILMRVYSIFVVLSTLHISILYVKTTIDVLQQGDLQTISETLTQAIIVSFSCFSSCYWLWHHKALSDFIEHINSEYWHRSLPGVTYVNFHTAYEKTRRITLVWLWTALIATVFWGLAPHFQGARSLIFKVWYPFDPQEPSVYPIVYSIQMFAQINIGITFSCGSALYLALIVLMIGQFDVLFCSLKNLQHHAELTSGGNLHKLRNIQAQLENPTDDEVNQYMFVKEEQTNLSRFENMFEKRSFNLALKESIVKCVKLHLFICKSCSILEEIFHPFCLVKSLQITMQLCLLAFAGVAGDRSPLHIITLLDYGCLTITELVMYCYCGELLKQHSVRSGDALFRSQWHSYAPSVRNDLLIFLINASRPMQLTAGKFFVMDLPRLRSVLAQAFSFLTLLQKLADKAEEE